MMQPEGDHRYFTSTAVFLNEVIKLAISATFALYEVSGSLAPQTPATVLFEQIYHSVFSGDGWKLAIPATLYTFENTLQYVALGNLDPVHFQILYQLKVHTSLTRTIPLIPQDICATQKLISADPHNRNIQCSPPRSTLERQAMDIRHPPYYRCSHCLPTPWSQRTLDEHPRL